MITAVDTDALLDLLMADSPEQAHSRQLLEVAASAGAVVICEVVFAELAASFPSRSELTAFVSSTGLTVDRIQPAALFLAGQAHRQYRRASVSACPGCGRSVELRCPSCGATYKSRQHILADFLIGAHAQLQADRLLTRDRGYYRTYFPDLRLAR